MKISAIYNEKYYLYLIPVQSSSEFDITNITIIQDPYKNVFNSNDWFIECETYFIKKKE